MARATPVRERAAMIAGMAPRLDAETWAFCTTADDALAARAAPVALASFAEDEGRSFVLAENAARALGFATGQPMARITLGVHSALDGVGLTAAVATALADAGIACNMVAAYHHDHAFVPAEHAARAMDILRDLSRRGAP